MFGFDGERSSTSKVIQDILKQSSLPFSADKKDSVTCVVYRRDPLDAYLFITAIAGVTQEEPMFGPIVYDDIRRSDQGNVTRSNPLGFQARENIQWHTVVEDGNKRWRIDFSGRGAKTHVMHLFNSINSQMQNVLSSDRPKDEPLFPTLWYRERVGRDKLREAFRSCPAPSSIPAIGNAITRAMKLTMRDTMVKAASTDQNDNSLGIYLNSGQNWCLIAQHETAWLPSLIGAPTANVSDGLNAVTWVSKSTRPVLIRPSMSAVWENRIKWCGPNFEKFISLPDFQGICIVPLLDYNPYNPPLGVVVFMSYGKSPITPGHLFLLNQLAVTASGYLVNYLPFPGCPYWRDIYWGRGTDRSNVKFEPPTSRKEQVERVVAQLMPENSSVELSPLKPGLSGASVYRCMVRDANGQLQFPRVIKIVNEPTIVIREAEVYYRHVHFQRVGYASRIDIAKVNETPDDRWAAIVYMLAGGGDKVISWDEWAADIDQKRITRALDILFEQLAPWYFTTHAVHKSATQLLITEPFFTSQNIFKPSLRSNKQLSWTAVCKQLQRLHKADKGPAMRGTCTIHGDLYANNLFSILSGDQFVQAALIDWGSVHSERLAVSDIAKLMADLVYRVRWGRFSAAAERQWAWEIVQNWQKRLSGHDEQDWRLALIHQMAKMLFYVAENKKSPYFCEEARKAAWRDLQALVDEFVRHSKPPIVAKR